MTVTKQSKTTWIDQNVIDWIISLITASSHSKTCVNWVEPDFGAAEDSYNEDDEDSGGSTVAVGAPTGPTPPDSPQMSRMRAARSMSYQYTGQIIPELDIYAISCKEGYYFKGRYFKGRIFQGL